MDRLGRELFAIALVPFFSDSVSMRQLYIGCRILTSLCRGSWSTNILPLQTSCFQLFPFMIAAFAAAAALSPSLVPPTLPVLFVNLKTDEKDLIAVWRLCRCSLRHEPLVRLCLQAYSSCKRSHRIRLQSQAIPSLLEMMPGFWQVERQALLRKCDFWAIRTNLYRSLWYWDKSSVVAFELLSGQN